MAHTPLSGVFWYMTKLIDKFYLGVATYYALDSDGNKIQLQVDYWGNKIKIENLTVISEQIIKMRDKVEAIGKSLLNRKHKVNFAYKYENL